MCSVCMNPALLDRSEGTRSRDGRLGQFKRGPFTMAQRAGVRIVPVTITGVTDAMPPFAMAPLRKVGLLTLDRCLQSPVVHRV